jgi:hypothetical protein
LRAVISEAAVLFYASQLLDPIDRAWLTKMRVKARLIGGEFSTRGFKSRKRK